jgi:hypothetical protein
VEFMASIPPLPVCITQERPRTEQQPLQREQSSPRSVFSSSCLARIRKVELHFETLTEVEGQEGSVGPVWE